MLSAPGMIQGHPHFSSAEVSAETAEETNAEPQVRRKPFLPPPQQSNLVMEDLWNEDHWLQLQAMLDISANNCFESNQKELDFVNSELEKAQAKQREAERVAREKEYEAGKWGVARLVFTWIASCAVVITGITLIATGIGVVAGCLMLAGGLIQVGSQIMELTDGWNKVRELLPGKDEDKKSAITSWIQIGITILSLILSGAGVVVGGFSFVGQNMQKGTALMGAIALIGKGASDLGEGVAKSKHKHQSADIKRREALMTKYKNRWQDVVEMQDESVKKSESVYKVTTHHLDMQRDFSQFVWGQG